MNNDLSSATPGASPQGSLEHRLGRRGPVLRPFCVRAAVDPRNTSRWLQRVLVDLGAQESLARAAQRVQEHYGVGVAPGRIRRHTLAHGAQRSALEIPPPRDAAAVLVTQMDGSLIPIVASPAHGADRRKGKLLHWREVRLCMAPHVEPETQTEAPVRATQRYLSGRRAQLDYASARAAGLQMGSGEVESGHRHVIQERLKLAGAWWKEANAEAMLGLRIARANHLWDSYWKHPNPTLS